MENNRRPSDRTVWQTAPELPEEVFMAWRKPNKALSPVAVVATVDPDGHPHTAPFGSMRAITPRRLRLISLRYHDTYINLCRDGRVMVALLTAPDIAVSVLGRARVAREPMDTDEHYAIVEIDIEAVKNDMVPAVVIESGVNISARNESIPWFQSVLGELEAMG